MDFIFRKNLFDSKYLIFLSVFLGLQLSSCEKDLSNKIKIGVKSNFSNTFEEIFQAKDYLANEKKFYLDFYSVFSNQSCPYFYETK